MAAKLLITLSFILKVFIFNSQTDTLNKFNAKGEKNGYWITYLDHKFAPADSQNAEYYGFDYYDNGKAVYKHKNDWWRKEYKLESDNSVRKGTTPFLLDGKYTWYKESDSLPIVVEEFSNGYPSRLTGYHHCEYHPYGISVLVDYSKRYNNQPGSHYVEYHDGYQRKIRKFWYNKERNRWKKRSAKG
jgi:hypothetical protein